MRIIAMICTSGWRAATESWVCEGPLGEAGCDPCGEDDSFDLEKNWKGLACRGAPAERGWITTMHITDWQVEGGLPVEICNLPSLRKRQPIAGMLRIACQK